MDLRAPLSAVGLFLFLACSSSSSSKSEDFTGSCKLLASRCHPVKTTLGKECHELGHDGDDTKCGPKKNECLAECPEGAGATDASVSDATVETDAGGDADAGPTPCQTYCTCVMSTCASEPNFPFATEAACLTACAGFTNENRACYAAECEEAKTADAGHDKEHACDHASGSVDCH